MHGPDGDYPSWLEVRESGYRTLVGSFVGQFGSARPISRVQFENGRLRFSMPPQWEKRTDDQQVEGRLEGDVLRGETTDEKGRQVAWEAHCAPSLKRSNPPQWGEPIELFNGRDLTGWKPRDASSKHGWVVSDGVLKNAEPGNDLLTERKFTDFKLRAEFRYPRGSNSGIYLRGRYEVQIEDDFGHEPDAHEIGGIYGFLTPIKNAGKAPASGRRSRSPWSVARSRWFSTANRSSTARRYRASRAERSTATRKSPGRSCSRGIMGKWSSETWC